jgi:hypothetical protein
LWDKTEIVIDTFSLPIAADAPAGDYDLAMGFYQWQTLERLPITDATTEVSGANAAILGPVDIAIK